MTKKDAYLQYEDLEKALEKNQSGNDKRHDDLRDELAKHYISWRHMLGIAIAISALYAYITPRAIAYETRAIDQKLDQILVLLNKH